MKRAYIAVLAVGCVLIAPLLMPQKANAFVQSFTFPPSIPAPFTDWVAGCANGTGSNPCNLFIVGFFNASSTYATSSAPVGSGDLIADLTGGAEVIQLSNALQYYPCSGNLQNCIATSTAPNVAANNGGGNPDGAQWLSSSRNVRDHNGNLLYSAYTVPSGVVFSGTHIISLVPTIIATSTQIDVTYIVNPDDLATTTASGGTVRFISRVSGLDTGFTSTSTAFIVGSAGVGTTSYSVLLPHAGLYQAYASLFVIDSGGLFGQVFDATTTDFTLVSDFYTSVFGTTTPTDQGIPYVACSASALAGCVQNALLFVFYPNRTALDMYAQFLDTAWRKPPAGYFVMIRQAMENVNASSTSIITGWTIPQGIIDSFFTPVASGITSVLGFFLLVQFYKRFKDVDLKG